MGRRCTLKQYLVVQFRLGRLTAGVSFAEGVTP